ncbi:ABC transporter substrate-binding protein [Amycolatopsis oliviviridis]|uniref:ABC transporter substrate-binding protein n=1 Tax=Amycolatopsis oliviviridis TaxID=1471590 RepID=A0ABQ3MAQ6_9PSEU|nr:ABC transporter substrate-binding protein [Amycolatopsis oliviviridis]GHH37901.1 ABC transporter substrate-binding protein [Amycolatopsis oliviviridis]
MAGLLAVIAGCGATEPDVAAGGVTIENCGVQVRVDKPPQRAVALDQEVTETLLALGLRDRIAGTALRSGPVAEEYRADYAAIPMLNPKELTGEQLRAADPDFAVTAFVSDFTRERVGPREEFATLGVPTYVSSVDCPKFLPGKTPFERLFTDYENFGKIFGVPDRAAALIAKQREVVAEAEKAGAARAVKPTVAYLYSVYNGAPYVAGGSGLPADLSRMLGATNVFADVDSDWPEVGWEQIAARNPSVIVLGDLPDRGEEGDAAEEKIRIMRAHPVLSQLDAVRAGRFIVVPGLELDATVRSVHALKLISDGLAKLG